MESKTFQIQGLVAATFTPFTNDGNLNLDIIDEYVEKLKNDNVLNIFVNGTTGEGYSLTLDERKKVAEKWVEASKGKLNHVIIHIGCNCLKDTQNLAEHAKSIGASAIAVSSTLYFKPTTVDDLALYLKDAGKFVPDIPLYYYHFGDRTGVNFLMEDLLSAIDKHSVTNFHGLKFTSFDLLDFGRCQAYKNGKYQIFNARDEVLLPSLTLGGKAYVGSTYNYAGKLNNHLIESFKKGDLKAAQKDMYISQAIIRVLRKHGGDVDANKYIMSLTGIKLGPTRAPLNLPSAENQVLIKQELTEAGFFEIQ